MHQTPPSRHLSSGVCVSSKEHCIKWHPDTLLRLTILYAPNATVVLSRFVISRNHTAQSSSHVMMFDHFGVASHTSDM